MLEMIELVQKVMNPDTFNSLEEKTGLDKSKLQEALGTLLPTMIEALGNNAQSEEGAAALANALDRDHDGSILENLSEAFEFGDKAEDTGKATDGLGIVYHMFGGQQEHVANQLSQSLGLNSATVMSLMAKLAPMVMGLLGKAKKDGGMDIGQLVGLLSMLSGVLGKGGSAQGGGGLMDMLGGLLGGGGNQASAQPESPLKTIGASILKNIFK